MICPTCKGKKIIEIMGGVIMKRCETCKGKGEMEDDPIDRDRPDNQFIGTASASITRQKRKLSARSKARIK